MSALRLILMRKSYHGDSFYHSFSRIFRRIVGLVLSILDSKYGHFYDARSACCVKLIEFRAVIDVGIVVVFKIRDAKIVIARHRVVIIS